MKPEFYMVCAWSRYYPSGSIYNIKGVFENLCDAEIFAEEFRKDEDYRDYYEIISSNELPWGGA